MNENSKISQIDRDKIKEELERKQVLDIQKGLIGTRRLRLLLMSFLLGALIFTVMYGTIENPFQHTFSQIGNRFTVGNRILFIVWALVVGVIIELSILALFKLENYKNKLHTGYIITAALFLFFTSLAPSLPDLPFWTWVHLVTAGLFALFITLGFLPFALWVARENPRLRQVIYSWMIVTWGGGSFWYITLGNRGVFEMWFFIFFIIFLLYLSLNLFEEQIVKKSIVLLKDEDNLNMGIEKIFINLEKEKRESALRRKKSNKKG